MTEQILAQLKGLVMDATRKANSGHPGGAMSSADFAVILFRDYLRFAPANPQWPDRDRFVLSAGHESMLLYSLLHFMDLLPIEEVQNFRQWGSLTPGHPESHLTPGVEATTGPLGQGISMAVGMAAAEKQLKSQLGEDFVNHKVYVLASDGDLQEPVALGTSALAGHLGLDNLVVFYDKNDIQISGKTSRSDSTDYNVVFQGLGWEVMEIDGHNHAEIRRCLDFAQANNTGKPLLIIGNTTIAKGTASMEGSHKTHGEPLKAEEIAATKAKLGLNPEQQFFVSAEVKADFCARMNQFNQEAEAWNQKLAARRAADADFNALYAALYEQLPTVSSPEFAVGEKLATRAAFGKVLEAWANQIPGLIGGSADLEPSNNTAAFAAKVGEFDRSNRQGRNLAFGVREFPMATMMNGMALHGGLLPFGATFLTFADYCRNAIRMSAIQQLQVLYVFTHDSIFLGEDGPTHQPIEHVMSLRAIPDLLVFRPADANETKACMEAFLTETHRPSLLALTRQNLPTLPYSDNAKRGGYICWESHPGSEPETVLFASGSEVSLAIDSAKAYAEKTQTAVRVVSLPCWELFFDQEEAYRKEVMSLGAKRRLSIEAGTTLGWERFTGLEGRNIGINTFGASAPAEVLAEKFGFTVHNVLEVLASM